MIVVSNASPLLALAQADVLLMDDRKARNEARDLGFQCAYTTDVLRLAEERDIVRSATEIVADLRNARIFLPYARDPGQGAH